jgi:hypothetical protein
MHGKDWIKIPSEMNSLTQVIDRLDNSWGDPVGD